MTASSNIQSSKRTTGRLRVVILGAGFAGLTLARRLARRSGAESVDVTLVDRSNYHTFQPLLYQVATAALEAEEIAHAVRGIFHRRQNIEFRMGTVIGVDFDRRVVLLARSDPQAKPAELSYDRLVLAVGATTATYGVPGVKEHAFGLKELSEAIDLRSHLIRQFERAHADPSLIDRGILNLVVVGGGPTGVEIAGAVAELIEKVLTPDFPSLDLSQARVVLIEATPKVLGAFHPSLSEYAAATLRSRGIEVLLETAVKAVGPHAVHLSGDRSIDTETVIWAAGVQAHPLAGSLGLEQTRGGRLVVEPDLSVPGRPEVYVIGDLAASQDQDGNLHPQLAPVAIQGAQYLAKRLQQHGTDGPPRKPFVYRDKGIMATIGRAAAVAQLPSGLKLRRFTAWLAWALLHIYMLIGFRNRLNVFVNWVWNYFTYDRSSRLIMSDQRQADSATMNEDTGQNG